jgi:hypothetical protein
MPKRGICIHQGVQMTPTSKLRFVERKVFVFVVTPKTIRVLQQWWEVEQNIIDRAAGKTQGEWRDVPLEEEQA